MYKLTRPDGYDFYSGTINYRDAIGTIVRITDYDPDKNKVCGRGLHASRNPNDCFVGATIPCAAFRVRGINKIAGDKAKSRYRALRVLEEIQNLDSLFGWNYSEASNPIHPLKILPPKITGREVNLLKMWASVRASVWDSLRASVWDSVGASVWDSVGASLGASVWDSVRASVWDSVRDSVGASLGASVWDSLRASVWDSVRASVWDSVRASVWDSLRASVWDSVRASVWDSVWAYIGSFFPNIKKWRYASHKRGEYPFQPCVDLWKLGFVPSFDGKLWRLHGNKNAAILWEGKL